jgi:MFS family permease
MFKRYAITIKMLSAQIGALLGFSTYAVCLTTLQHEWQLSNFEAGLIASSFFLGYVLFVPLSTVLTDRIDSRKVYLIGSLLAIIGLSGMGFLARGFYTASFFMLIQGAGLAGTYMPGLKVISDRVQTGEITRHISFYTAFFGLGTGLSFLIAGVLLHHLNWQSAFIFIALGPLSALLIVEFLVKPNNKKSSFKDLALSWNDVLPIKKWKEVLENKKAAFFILGYTVHSLELFASRNWLVAYFVFCAAFSGQQFLLSATELAAIINLFGVPASIIGNEIALKIGRRQWVNIVMLTSACIGILLGYSSQFNWWLIITLAALHASFIAADSGTLTAGLVTSSNENIKGAAMGLHSLMGFGGGLLGPAIFGFALDLNGSNQIPMSWTWAYFAIVIWSFIFVIYANIRPKKSVHTQ